MTTDSNRTSETLAGPEVLEALDAAVRGIAGVMSVDMTLQLIVDGVRELVSAQYAALGIVSEAGLIEQFITSGLSADARDRIGPLPRGHGLLGLIIREDRSIIIDDLNADERRHGFPPHHPEMTSFLGVPVRSKGRTIGNLYLTNKLTAPGFSQGDRRLVEMFGLHAGIAMENARLHEEVRRLAVVDERERISQDLHDSIIQSLYAISLSLEDLPDVITDDPVEGAALADRAIESIHGTIRDIRGFIMGLQPPLLEEGELAGMIETIAGEFRATTDMDLDLRLPADLPNLPPDRSTHLLAIIREGLSNIARHSGATRAWLELRIVDDGLSLVIGDDGRGFHTGRPQDPGHHGLSNLRSRAEAMGGTLEIVSSPGAGTIVSTTFSVGPPD